MRIRRHRIAIGLASSALFFSGSNALFGVSFLQDLAVVAWASIVAYAALALVAVALGYLDPASLGIRRRSVAPVPADENTPVDDSVFYAEEDHGLWQREPARYALG
jgi:hypothetical protein